MSVSICRRVSSIGRRIGQPSMQHGAGPRNHRIRWRQARRLLEGLESAAEIVHSEKQIAKVVESLRIVLGYLQGILK